MHSEVDSKTPALPRLQKNARGQLWGSRSVDLFQKIEHIGEGTYGKVYMAKNKETGDIVALKKVRMDNEKEGFPITAIREIKILKELRHDNIVELKEIVTSTKRNNKGISSIYMVFEYMDHDLTGLMLNDGNMFRPSLAQTKCYMKQLLEGLHYCHSNNVLHRDIKGSNLLISNKGILKLADFGLARPFTEQPGGKYTNRVITLWYRPPELLLGAEQYGPAIDIWSAGCILAELLENRAIFPGKNEIDQLELIWKICGTPTEENWPDVAKLPWWSNFKPARAYPRAIRQTFKNIHPTALDLLEKMLALDPAKRITAAEALDSDFFWTAPEPCKPSEIPVYPSCHELQAKKRRQAAHEQSQNMKRQKVTHGGPGPAPSSQQKGYPPGYYSQNRQQNGRYPPPPPNYDNRGRPPQYYSAGRPPYPHQPYHQPPHHSQPYPQTYPAPHHSQPRPHHSQPPPHHSQPPPHHSQPHHPQQSHHPQHYSSHHQPQYQSRSGYRSGPRPSSNPPSSNPHPPASNPPPSSASNAPPNTSQAVHKPPSSQGAADSLETTNN